MHRTGGHSAREAGRPGRVLAFRPDRCMTSTAGLPSWTLGFFIWKIRQNDHPYFLGLPWRWQDPVCRGLSRGVLLNHGEGGRGEGGRADWVVTPLSNLRFKIAVIYKPRD